MTRLTVPFNAPDLSQFARSLARSLEERAGPPGHVELMNLLARAAGHRNVQSLRAAALKLPRRPIAREDLPAPPGLSARARRALGLFDTRGRMVRWPNRLSVQRLALWVLWTRFEPRRVYAERDVNDIIKAWHTWGDHATLRRELVNHRLLERKSDCSEYRKVPARADDEARALLRAYRATLTR